MNENTSDKNIHIHGDVHNSNLGTGDYGQQQINTVSPTPPNSIEREKLLILLGKVREFWIENVLEQAVDRELWIELGKRVEKNQLHQPWDTVIRVLNQKAQLLGKDEKLSKIFLAKGKSLLILGNPGAGKTMTLLDLARDLLDLAEKNELAPVPVVFNLSSWSDKYDCLQDWLLNEFKEKYYVNKELSQKWLDKQQVCLLLDGLDEVKAEFRESCVEAMNTFVSQYELGGLAVCCRITEYKALSQCLQFGFAVRLKHLTQTQIQDYLQQAGERFSSLDVLLQQDKKLRKLARSPFMLSVMSFAYENVPAEEVQQLKSADLKQRQNQLFDKYVEQALDHKGKQQVYKKEFVKDKLSWLGFQMQQHGQSVFTIESLKSSFLLSSAQKILLGSISSLIYILFGAVSFIPILFLTKGIVIGLAILILFFIAGIVISLIWGIVELFGGFYVDIQKFEKVTLSWDKFRQDWYRGIILGFVIGMVFSSMLILVDWFSKDVVYFHV